MKANNYKELSQVELNKELSDLKSELFKLRFQAATNQLQNPMQLKVVKKNIARVKTVLRVQEITASNK